MKNPANPFKLAVSLLSHEVFAGRVRQKDGYSEIVGVRHNVTNDFYGALIQLGEAKGGTFTISAKGVPQYEVSVRKIEPPEARDIP